jgi:acetoin utilization protein AcuC
VVPPLVKAFDPDVIVTQLGVDSFYNDPLANLSLTTKAFTLAVRFFKSLGLPWVALGGGGYHLVNVARAWTLAWSIMLDQELAQQRLPTAFQETIHRLNYHDEWLKDGDIQEENPAKKERAFQDAWKTVRTIKETIFPIHEI